MTTRTTLALSNSVNCSNAQMQVTSLSEAWQFPHCPRGTRLQNYFPTEVAVLWNIAVNAATLLTSFPLHASLLKAAQKSWSVQKLKGVQTHAVTPRKSIDLSVHHEQGLGNGSHLWCEVTRLQTRCKAVRSSWSLKDPRQKQRVLPEAAPGHHRRTDFSAPSLSGLDQFPRQRT